MDISIGMETTIWNAFLGTFSIGLHAALLLYFIFAIINGNKMDTFKIKGQNFKAKAIFWLLFLHPSFQSIIFDPFPSFILRLSTAILYFLISIDISITAYKHVRLMQASDELNNGMSGISDKNKGILKDFFIKNGFHTSTSGLIVFLLFALNLDLMRFMFSHFSNIYSRVQTEVNISIDLLKNPYVLSALFVFAFYLVETIALKILVFIVNSFLKIIKFRSQIIFWGYILLSVGLFCLAIINFTKAYSEYKFL